MDDAVGRTLPWDVRMRRKKTHICSTLVLDALLVGGLSIAPEALPETPNELLQAVQELAGISTYQGHKSPERTHTMFDLLGWLKNRALKLPQADDNVVDKTLGIPAGTTAALNTEAVDIAEGDAAAAIEKAVTGK